MFYRACPVVSSCRGIALAPVATSPCILGVHAVKKLASSRSRQERRDTVPPHFIPRHFDRHGAVLREEQPAQTNIPVVSILALSQAPTHSISIVRSAQPSADRDPSIPHGSDLQHPTSHHQHERHRLCHLSLRARFAPRLEPSSSAANRFARSA